MDIRSATTRPDNIGGGVRLVLNNTSGEQITLSQVDVVIKGAAYGA